MNTAMMKAEALERRGLERRRACVIAAARYCEGLDRWKAERRATDSANVAAWVARYEAARKP